MQPTIVDRLFDEFSQLVIVLDEQREISLHVTADDTFRKALLLAAASHFEHQICKDLVDFVSEGSGKNQLVGVFVKKRAITRQYHTLFAWEGGNANSFFALFGESFKKFMENQVKGKKELQSAVKAFLEIGNERNRLVHQDFGAFPLEKTAQEIYDLYKTALPFVDAIPEKLREFCREFERNEIEP